MHVNAVQSNKQFQQFVSLKNFVAYNTLQKKFIHSPCKLYAIADEKKLDGIDILRNTQHIQRTVNNVSSPLTTAIEDFPPYEEWRDHPELLTGCEPSSAPLRIAVLLSGGVDSSLALHLLHAAGHKITAYYLKIWFQEDFRNFWDACPWEEDLKYCQAVCDRLNIELKVVPLSDEYWDRVVSHCISEVKKGRTPNPDILCNSRVKFGAFLEHLERKEGKESFDRIASGHYARREDVPIGSNTNTNNNNRRESDNTSVVSNTKPITLPSSSPLLHKEEEARLALTPDILKDQTYFLAHLHQHQLSKILFPLGTLTKPQVRALASAAALPNQSRKDSQGICFLGKVRFSEFIKHHLGEWPGPIIEEESGNILGYHKGFWFHTVGQRKGVPLSGGPWYVTKKVPDDNAVYVSREYHALNAAMEKKRHSFFCEDFHWTSSVRIDFEKTLHCKVRHGAHMYICTTIEIIEPSECRGDIQRAFITLDGIDQGLAAGQYAVFYQDGFCLGCAVIANE